MICRNIDRTIAIGSLRLDSSRIIFKVLDFLDKNIDGFPQFLSNSNFDEENEKAKNQMLATYLNNITVDYFVVDTFRFCFIKDTSIKGSQFNPDIGVMLGNKIATTTSAFFHIECKRLPARKGFEREYVQDKLGGIQRFKEGNHGAGLKYSAMIGYIESNTFEHWHLNINFWINELINSVNTLNWNEDDKLIQRKKEDFQRYTSIHKRYKHTEPIKLYHYWISV